MAIPARVAADAQQADNQLAEMAAQVAAAARTPTPDPTPDPTPEPAPAPAPAAAPTPAPAAVVPVDDATLRRMQAQLDSLQGRYEAALTRSEQQQQEIQRLQAASAPAPAPAPAPAAPRFTQQQLDEFGEETLAMVQQLAAAQTQPLLDRIEQLQQQLAGVEGRTERLQRDTQQAVQTQRQTAGQLYLGHLDRMIPGWRAVNDDPGFVTWLEGYEPLSGEKLGDLLQKAHSSLDHARVASIFSAYKPDLANGNPPPAAAPAAPKAPTVDPTTVVAPSTSASSASPAPPPPGEVYTQAMYDKAMDDKLKKRITPAQFEAFEQKFFAAARDGRVSLTT